MCYCSVDFFSCELLLLNSGGFDVRGIYFGDVECFCLCGSCLIILGIGFGGGRILNVMFFVSNTVMFGIYFMKFIFIFWFVGVYYVIYYIFFVWKVFWKILQ